MQKLFIILSAALLATLVACGGAGGTPAGTSAPPYGESVEVALTYNCESSGMTATATGTFFTVESLTAAAYFEMTTIAESQIMVTQSGNCNSSNTSIMPMCVYTYTWNLATAPLQTFQFQLNGAPGPLSINENQNVGGPNCIPN